MIKVEDKFQGQLSTALAKVSQLQPQEQIPYFEALTTRPTLKELFCFVFALSHKNKMKDPGTKDLEQNERSRNPRFIKALSVHSHTEEIKIPYVYNFTVLFLKLA